MDRDSVEPGVQILSGKRARRWADRHDLVTAGSTYVTEFVGTSLAMRQDRSVPTPTEQSS